MKNYREGRRIYSYAELDGKAFAFLNGMLVLVRGIDWGSVDFLADIVRTAEEE